MSLGDILLYIAIGLAAVMLVIDLIDLIKSRRGG